ncbi:Cuticle protein 8 [Frankliniella fusca]|uniref:Cuticle protein 8 n=1 Tax=Frankliniella fusca TaxID=407009 RepID=A0AAE1L645_9NEOP|nr:Cuticle protein 8 [Frankliniella fusca]
MAGISKVTLLTLALSALVAAALAGGHADSYIHIVHSPSHGYEPSYHHEEYHHEPSPYSYKYGVHDAHTGDVKSASESSHGGVVKGEYSLVQPDGVTRTVHYTADKHNGFNAHVSLHGHAHHGHHY